MAHSNGDRDGGLPIDQFTKSTPPGWQEGLPHYPFRLYKQKMNLWSHTTDLMGGQIGPAMAA